MVRINDHGPFYGDRIIDLSLAAAKAIGVYRAGTAKVRLEAYAPPAGYDPQASGACRLARFLDSADAIRLQNDLVRRYATAKVTEFAGATGHWGADQTAGPGQGDRYADSGQHSHPRPQGAALSCAVELGFAGYDTS